MDIRNSESLIFNIYLFIAAVLSLGYVLIMLKYIEGWQALPTWEIPPSFQATTKVSILIPARNEEESIAACVQSAVGQNYPSDLFEVIVINDHSTDRTSEILSTFHNEQLRILELKDYIDDRSQIKSFKKKALEIAIAQTTGDLIVTTDADCEMGPDWLIHLVAFYEVEKVRFIAAPVNFHKEKNLFEKFQSLDFLGMIGVTGAVIHRRFMNMCNGANLAYDKKTFYAVNGFEGIDQLASGDDMLLMQKIAKQYPEQIGFIKNKAATVYTHAQATIHDFLQQRIRWATKSYSYPEWKVTVILAMVYLFCNSIVLSLLLVPFFGSVMCWILLSQLVIKAVMDFVFLKRMSAFFDRQDLMSTFVSSFFYHIVYIVVVGLLGNVIKEYRWKGRKVK